jgi:hypothetical protein
LQTIGNRLNESTIENEQIQVPYSNIADAQKDSTFASNTCCQFKLKEREEEIRLLRKTKQDLQFRVQVCRVALCYFIFDHFHCDCFQRIFPILSHFVSSQMEEESRQRAQDALELARRHEEEDAVRRGQSGMSDLISPQNYFCFSKL